MKKLTIGLIFVGVTAVAQWIDYPTPGTPRTNFAPNTRIAP